MEISVESAMCDVDKEVTKEKGVGVASGSDGAGVGRQVAASGEELDLDQVKGRMLTMAGLFEIWQNDIEVCSIHWSWCVLTMVCESLYSGKISWGLIFADRLSSKFSRFYFR